MQGVAEIDDQVEVDARVGGDETAQDLRKAGLGEIFGDAEAEAAARDAVGDETRRLALEHRDQLREFKAKRGR